MKLTTPFLVANPKSRVSGEEDRGVPARRVAAGVGDGDGDRRWERALVALFFSSGACSLSPVNLTLPAIRDGVQCPVGQWAAAAVEGDDGAEAEAAAGATPLTGDGWPPQPSVAACPLDQHHGAEYAENRCLAAPFG
jgi:hypothetical protein